MPSLGLHLGIAWDAACQVGHPALRENPGAYYLGATSPDIRIITGSFREETHFYDLKGPGEESGASRFLQDHPELAQASRLDPAAGAFVAGYLGHLVTDEVWISLIYRPYFGPSAPLAGGPLSSLLDRALQYELERRERQDREKMAKLRAHLGRSALPLGVDFIDGATLDRWRAIACRATAAPPSWRRFRGLARLYLKPQGLEMVVEAREFMGHLPASLEPVLKVVTEERLAEFRRAAVKGSAQTARSYLG